MSPDLLPDLGARRQARDLADAQARPVGRRQCRSVALLENRFQKTHNLVDAQHHRQPLWLAGGDMRSSASVQIQGGHGDMFDEPHPMYGRQFDSVLERLSATELSTRIELGRALRARHADRAARAASITGSSSAERPRLGNYSLWL